MKKFVFLLTVLVCVQAQAKTLVISDIDDTLKQSHVLNNRDMILNARRTDNPFLGMGGAMVALQQEHPDFKFIYLSNAIDSIMRPFHSRFLTWNGFPQGALYLRRSVFDKSYKLTSLRQIFALEKPDAVILLGDNGERDAEIYEQVRNEYPAIAFQTFIHLVYSSSNPHETGVRVRPEQQGYATAFDLMMSLSRRGVVSLETTTRFFADYAPKFLMEDPLQSAVPVAIPLWMDCGDFKDEVVVDPLKEAFYTLVQEKIDKRCEKRELF